MKRFVPPLLLSLVAGCASTGLPSTAAVAVGDLPSLYQSLFRDKALQFNWHYSVDTHDPEHPQASESGVVACRLSHSTLAQARLALMTCQVESSTEGSLLQPTSDFLWIATRDGLWLAHHQPADASALAGVLAQAPLIPASLEPYREELPTPEDPAELFGDEDPGYVELSNEGGLWCNNRSTPGPFGRVSAVWCFEPEVGLSVVQLVNVEGPSEEKFDRP